MQARTQLILAAAVLGAGVAYWHHRTQTSARQTGEVLPSLELPVPSAEPFVVPDPVADPLDAVDGPNRPHLTLLGDLPLDDPHPSADEDTGAASEGATVTHIGEHLGNNH